eukprot:4443424-Pleurochrysis_carterae.AAC.4
MVALHQLALADLPPSLPPALALALALFSLSFLLPTPFLCVFACEREREREREGTIWLMRHDTSPLTGARLATDMLIPIHVRERARNIGRISLGATAAAGSKPCER